MNRIEIANIVNEIFQNDLEIDTSNVTEESSIKIELIQDSLAYINMLAAIENRFNCVISIEDLSNLHTIGDLYNLIQIKLNN